MRIFILFFACIIIVGCTSEKQQAINSLKRMQSECRALANEIRTSEFDCITIEEELSQDDLVTPDTDLPHEMSSTFDDWFRRSTQLEIELSMLTSRTNGSTTIWGDTIEVEEYRSPYVRKYFWGYEACRYAQMVSADLDQRITNALNQLQ